MFCGQVRCGLPPFELPGSSNVKLEVSNDGAEWSRETFQAMGRVGKAMEMVEKLVGRWKSAEIAGRTLGLHRLSP